MSRRREVEGEGGRWWRRGGGWGEGGGGGGGGQNESYWKNRGRGTDGRILKGVKYPYPPKNMVSTIGRENTYSPMYGGI